MTREEPVLVECPLCVAMGLPVTVHPLADYEPAHGPGGRHAECKQHGVHREDELAQRGMPKRYRDRETGELIDDA